MTDATGDNAWRRVVAALANDDVRRAAGALFLGADPEGELAKLSPSRRRHVVSTLVGSGIATGDDGALTANPSVFAELLAQRPARRATGIERFLRDGRIVQYPMNTAERGELLAWVARRALKPGEVVSEKEMNERVRPFSDNVAILRRYLVDYGLVERRPDGREYALAADASPHPTSPA